MTTPSDALTPIRPEVAYYRGRLAASELAREQLLDKLSELYQRIGALTAQRDAARERLARMEGHDATK